MPREYRQEDVRWEAREVIRELDGRAHRLLRVDVTGAPFPQRALEPVARIVGADDEVAASWFATISEDERTLSAYFPLDVPDRGVLEFGYFPVITGRVAVDFVRATIGALDDDRLPDDVIPVTRAYLKGRGVIR